MISGLKRTLGFIHKHPLAKRHLFLAYYQFLSWQIKSFINASLQPVKFLGSIRFLAKKGLTGVTGNIYTGLHEFEDMCFLLHFLKPGDVFFDVGANVGSYTLLASGSCGAKSISFEPIPATYAILKQNIYLNNLNDLVTSENKGVGSKNEVLYFTATEDTTNHIVLANQEIEHTISVPIVTLNDYYLHQKPNLIKIDVEGFETEVLNGATEILKDNELKAIIIELNGSGGRYGYDEIQIHQKLVDYGFRPYQYFPFERRLKKIASFGSYNTIYIRDIDTVENRIKSSKPIKIFNEQI
ncbi:FkbM family methyltransferase [Pedobacter frigiditerrae]|uniref:FkbM family methyltransferase n=1 Tax=Pedobacter frigiditerrae TaxID=2530452 RepID=A0A4R0MYB1_9SPHI|nr:FkbM family methyltransferase [Pedobacter frigiditerrae]TCC92260.1 FkbM family methyltransferase [Pedobacter frigiditerrae]